MHGQDIHHTSKSQLQSLVRTNISQKGQFIERRHFTFRGVVAGSTLRHCSAEEFILRLELLSRGREDGSECRPSQLTLARDGWMDPKTVRGHLKVMRNARQIVHCGKDDRGLDVWQVKLPEKVSPKVHGRMVLRAFQHRLKPLPRAILIILAGYADKEGFVAWNTPFASDFAAWLQVGDDAIWRAISGLVTLGLITELRRSGAGRLFRVTLRPEAMAWIPGENSSARETAIFPTYNRDFPYEEPRFSPQSLVPITDIRSRIPLPSVAAPPRDEDEEKQDIDMAWAAAQAIEPDQSFSAPYPGAESVETQKDARQLVAAPTSAQRLAAIAPAAAAAAAAAAVNAPTAQPPGSCQATSIDEPKENHPMSEAAPTAQLDGPAAPPLEAADGTAWRQPPWAPVALPQRQGAPADARENADRQIRELGFDPHQLRHEALRRRVREEAA